MSISDTILAQINPSNYFNKPFAEYMHLNHQKLNIVFKTNCCSSQTQKVLRGKINEILISLYFIAHGISNLYPQANLFYIPDIKYDLVLFQNTKRIVVFGIKTSLRERYKQNILEAQQLKKLDTRFEYYLLTNDAKECQRMPKT